MATFKEQLIKAGTGSTPPTSSLRFLSDLGLEDRTTLRQEWPHFSTERRRRIVSALATLTEDNIELDFRQVFLIALEDSDPQVRVTAIEGLFEDESKALLTRLVRLVREDPEARVREAAATALGRFTYLAHCDKLGPQGDNLRSVLLESARDEKEDSDVRRRAVEALGFFHEDSDVQGLIGDLYKRGGSAAESALFAMGRSMDDQWQSVVLRELESDRPAMRYEAARAAGEMSLKQALQHLVLLVDDADAEVRLASVWALGQIGGKPAIQALTRVLKSNDPALREAAQDAMAELTFAANPLQPEF